VSRAKAVAVGLLAAVLVSLSFSGSAAAAGSVPLYGNSMKTSNGRAQIFKKGAGTCVRGGSKVALRFRAGRKTKACTFAVPTVGRDLEVTVTGRIFTSIPRQLKKSMFLALNVRQARDGSQYQLAVFPSGRRFQIRKIFPNGATRILKAGRGVASIRGFGKANKISLRAYNGVPGQPASSARLVARVNSKLVGVADDVKGNELLGRDTSFGIASARNATGTSGSFESLLVRIPNPF
jgi:hypothetical protein